MQAFPGGFSHQEIRYLKGIGPKKAAALEKLGVRTLRDLFFLFPRRYEDRNQWQHIASLSPEQNATIQGEILSVRLRPIPRYQILEVTVGDETGTLPVVWFNQAYLKKQFEIGKRVILFGKVEVYKKRLQMTSPEYEVLDTEEVSIHTGRITPIYPLTEGLFQRSLRSTMSDLIQNRLQEAPPEFYPLEFRARKKLMDLHEAVREMHFPASFETLETARRRIAFDEFFLFEMILLRRLEKMRKTHRAFALPGGSEFRPVFESSLPFRVTQDQGTALEALARDLEQEIPMNRLLEGDVGSGKTLCACFAVALAARNSRQAAILVPTEILAEQHYRTLQRFLKPFTDKIALLTSSTPTPKRERMLAELHQGKIDVLVGTHALLQEDVRFRELALLVIDEQHKFGVYQRCKLVLREPRPHQLVMTATPIPRTLALTVYGDLAVSTLRELPAGRQPITTYWTSREKQRMILERIRRKIEKGEQAYFIFPLIEETERSDLLAAENEYRKLKDGPFQGIAMGLVHGRMSKDERDPVMEGFRKGEIRILVATSVIEVGVDHPNATMMVIENAERFGLSQLHQMRGRIGRGTQSSECFLFGEPTTEEGKQRLKTFASVQDGFKVAEEDLRLRGPGDFLGVRQSGEPFFKVADPLRDASLLEEARTAALELIGSGAVDSEIAWRNFHNHMQDQALHY
ncbi:MAG: ATP-dependent DNA helicase RecG [Candidatus Omnitrophota bacterium]